MGAAARHVRQMEGERVTTVTKWTRCYKLTDENHQTHGGTQWGKGVVLCVCGCGLPTHVATKSYRASGARKGEPCRFRRGHGGRKMAALRGASHPNWRGGRCVPTSGNYVHLRNEGRGRKLEHVAIAESVLGKALPPRAQVRHVDGSRQNNAHKNLVVCENQAYHHLLHTRDRALAATGDANARRCESCGAYDRQEEISTFGRNRVRHRHRSCHAVRERVRRGGMPQ